MYCNLCAKCEKVLNQYFIKLKKISCLPLSFFFCVIVIFSFRKICFVICRINLNLTVFEKPIFNETIIEMIKGSLYVSRDKTQRHRRAKEALSEIAHYNPSFFLASVVYMWIVFTKKAIKLTTIDQSAIKTELLCCFIDWKKLDLSIKNPLL